MRRVMVDTGGAYLYHAGIYPQDSGTGTSEEKTSLCKRRDCGTFLQSMHIV